jgi:hypothetical protein
MATTTPALAIDVRQPRPEPPRPLSLPRLGVQFAVMAAALVLVGAFVPAPIAVLVVPLALLPWLTRAPVRAVYLLVAAATIVEIFPLRYPDSLTDKVPLFGNLSNLGVPGLAMNPLEVLLIEASLIALVRAAGEGTIRLPRGPLVGPYVAFVGVVLFAEIHGLFSGADFKLSLWELRPQAYAFVLFLLATALVRDRRQLATLAVVLLLAATAKALVGDYRWQFTLNHDLGGRETLLAHEDSYFLLLYLVALAVSLVWFRRRAVLVPLLAGAPLVALCLLANQRRAGLFALAGGLAVVAVLVIRYEPRARKAAIALSAVALIAIGVFVAASWNVEYGIRAQLVRPVRSLIDPSVRDTSSDAYRTAEDGNLKVTFQQDPLLGMGFGLPYLTIYPQADISYIYPLWNVIPHNTLLWLPMRMGVPGMVTFFGLIGMAVLQAGVVLRRSPDPLARATAAFAAAAIVAELLVAYGDLQLESYRNLIMVGALLGVMNNLPNMKPEPTSDA